MDNEASNTPAQVSDKSFYLIMLAMIVGMGLYVSYDVEHRYGSGDNGSGNTVESSEITTDDSAKASDHSVSPDKSSADVSDGSASSAVSTTSTEGSVEAVENKPAQQASEASAPASVSIEKVTPVEVKPAAEVSATETHSEAVGVEKSVYENSDTTALSAAEKAPVENEKTEPATEQLSVTSESASVITTPAVSQETVEETHRKADDSAIQTTETKSVIAATSDNTTVSADNQEVAEVVAVPVLKDAGEHEVVAAPAVEDSVEQNAAETALSSESISATQAEQRYNPYDYPYGTSYRNNPYPPQRPYRKPSRNTYRGDDYYSSYKRPYRRSYRDNPYSRQRPYPEPYSRNRYGYDYNPYQQAPVSVE